MEKIEFLILRNLLHNEKYIRKVIPFIKSEYFEDQNQKIVFEEILSFVQEYNQPATKEVLCIEVEKRTDINEQSFKEIAQIISCLEDVPAEFNWLIDTTEKWCRDRAIYLALMESIHIADGNDKKSPDAIPSILQDALAVSFDNHVGHDYLEDYEKRYESYHRKEDRIEFDLEYFNKITKGGLPNKTLNICLAGTGCHGKGTKILLYDGTVKPVEDINCQDILVGDDGSPRFINYLIRDKGQMYRIKINDTDDEMVVNEDHILSLINTSTKKIVNITVKDYLSKSKRFKHLHKSYYNKTQVPFSKRNLTIDPYFMGLYLGDGHTHNCSLTSADYEVLDYVKTYVSENFDYIDIKECNNGSRATTLKLIDNYYNGFGKRVNRLSSVFKSYGLNITQLEDRTKCGEKFIPFEYKR